MKKYGIIAKRRKKQIPQEKMSFRFAGAVLIAMISLSAVNIPMAGAYFTDTVISSGNTISSGTLNIALSNNNINIAGSIHAGESTTTQISILNTGTLGSQYIASTTITGTDTEACNYLSLMATDGINSHTTPLKDFTSTATTTTNTVWNFNISVSPSVPSGVYGKTCSFKWVYVAWQENLVNNTQGFTDVKEISGSIRIDEKPPVVLVPNIVLNEILPDPIGSDTDSMPQGEWVELFNNSDFSVDLSGYYLVDGNNHKNIVESCRTMNGNNIISAKGFLVLYRKGGNGCSGSSFSLNNNGDTVKLYNPDDTLLDSLSYTDSVVGKSIARITDGTGEWVDPIPTPGKPNVMEETVAGGSFVAPQAEEEVIESEEIIIEQPLQEEDVSLIQPAEPVVEEEVEVVHIFIVPDETPIAETKTNTEDIPVTEPNSVVITAPLPEIVADVPPPPTPDIPAPNEPSNP